MTDKRRLYSGTDGRMTTISSVLQGLFVDNMSDFTALDASLNAEFASQWREKITEAGSVSQYSQIRDIQGQITERLTAHMALCRIKYTEIKYFAHKTFPKDTAIHAEFGTQVYGAASSKPTLMITFLDEMHKACLKYQSQLIATSLPQSSIDEIQTLRSTLLNISSEQEGYMRGKVVLTQNRIRSLNNCYRQTKIIMDAARVVYKYNYAMRKMFVFGSK